MPAIAIRGRGAVGWGACFFSPIMQNAPLTKEVALSTSTNPKLSLAAQVVPFEDFWRWLQAHPNCILSVGTADVILYDAEDFHWHFAAEGEENLLLQVLRGKHLVGELVIDPRDIAYVQVEAKGEEEYVFDCIEETEEGPVVGYYFTLSHGYDPSENQPVKGRWVH